MYQWKLFQYSWLKNQVIRHLFSITSVAQFIKKNNDILLHLINKNHSENTIKLRDPKNKCGKSNFA